MRKTRKLGKQVKRKHKSKRLGRGREEAVPYYINKILNAASLRSHNQNFYEPMLVSQILKDVPRASVTEAIDNAPYKNEVAHLLSQKLNQTAKSANSLNRAIASKIIKAVPTTHLIMARQKTALTKELEIAQAALNAFKTASQPIHERKKELYNELGDLEDQRDELEKAIGYSKLDKYDDLKDKYDKLVKSESMLKRSRASLIRIRLETQRYGNIGKLNALNAKIEKVSTSYSKANIEDIAAYDEQDRLTIIVRDLERQLEDLKFQERN
jgi:hypothetical protein